MRRLLANNRELYEKARATGGMHYPVDAIPLTSADWHAHYGARYPIFAATKRRHDPNQVLTPGQGIVDR